MILGFTFSDETECSVMLWESLLCLERKSARA